LGLLSWGGQAIVPLHVAASLQEVEALHS